MTSQITADGNRLKWFLYNEQADQVIKQVLDYRVTIISVNGVCTGVLKICFNERVNCLPPNANRSKNLTEQV